MGPSGVARGAVGVGSLGGIARIRLWIRGSSIMEGNGKCTFKIMRINRLVREEIHRWYQKFQN